MGSNKSSIRIGVQPGTSTGSGRSTNSPSTSRSRVGR
uniref:Uncharacterized protein n=1 Tax=Rhizophora mucronata TaxID=61149 RepID=A0A2P2MXJ7_RHIMU